MRVAFVLTTGLLLAGSLLAQSNPVPFVNQPLVPDAIAARSGVVPANRSVSVAQLGHLPLAFEENRGQANGEIKCLSHGLTPEVAFTSDKAIVSADGGRVLSLQFLNSTGTSHIAGGDLLPGKVNYIRGKDSSKWITQVPTFSTVKYVGVYPGIDVRFHGKRSELEYDFDLAPGADPRQIRIEFGEGVRVRPQPDGILKVESSSGEVFLQHAPKVFQNIDHEQKQVPARTVVQGNDISFELGPYNHSFPLVIDPAIVYETQIGGNVASVAVNAAGETFLAGNAGFGFFSTPGAFQPNDAGGGDAFVMKLSSDGQSVLYATFLGGTGSDIIYKMALNASGNAYVVGTTTSTNFPVTPSAFQGVARGGQCGNGFPCNDAFITVLNNDGSVLVYSSYLGGSVNDAAFSVAVDPTGAAYMTGITNWPDFPTTSGAFKNTCTTPPNYFAFVSKIDPTKSGVASLVYSTFVCGNDANESDYGWGIAVGGNGQAFVVGDTGSTTLATPGAFQTKGGNMFVAKLNATGSGLVFATLLGGSTEGGFYCPDGGRAIAIDSSGNSYVTGLVGTIGFPTTPGAFQTVKKSPVTNAFVAKFNPTGSALLYSTLLGGSGGAQVMDGCVSDVGLGIATDQGGNAYVTGQTSSVDFPITATTIEPVCNAGQGRKCVAFVSFVTEVNPTGTDLAFSTYLGSNTPAGVSANATTIALDESNRIYVAGTGTLPPINAPSPPLTGFGFLTKIDLTAVAPAAALLPTNSDFGIVALGSSSQLALKLTDRGDAVLSIANVAFSGDSFTESNDCPTSLPPAASCTITVTFSPTTEGVKEAQVMVSDSAFDSPHFAYILGTGGIARGQVNVSSVSFGEQALNTTSKAQPVKLSNTGNAALTITSITTTGDFAQTNTCGNLLPAGKSCIINVTFTPTELGSRSGILTIVSNSSDTIPPILLGGMGVPSLNLGIPPNGTNTATVTAGSAAHYTLSIGGGGLSGTATLSCSGSVPGGTCSVPASVPVDANTPSTFDVSVSTTARSDAILLPFHRSLAWFWAVGIFPLMLFPIKRKVRRVRRVGLPALLIVFLVSCGGGSGNNGDGGNGSGGTPVGTYNLTVKATMGNTAQSTGLKLTVK